MISPIIKWDHQENYVVPLFDSFNFFEKRNVSINLSDKMFEFVQGHIIDGEGISSACYQVFTLNKYFQFQERFYSRALGGYS